MSAKIGVVSLGCPKNQIDCEHMLKILDDEGYELTTDIAGVDAIIINTCGFIASAREEAYENIREAITLKAEESIGKIVVTGCLAERYKDDLLKDFPEIDALVGCGGYGEIAEVMKRTLGGEHMSIYPAPEESPLECGRMLTTPDYTAFIKIAEGCDNHCTYCIIPSLRGGLRSRKPEDILAEAEGLAKLGTKELIVVAQDTSRYGLDICGKSMLPELLRKLCRIDGIEWVRVHYLYPDIIDDELIDVLAKEDKIVKYLDIPIQHINDRLLKLMNRRTTRLEIETLIKKLRERIPGVVIRTSLIVGFPGETDEEFEELCDFLNEYKLERAGVFTYSREEGTAAARLPDQIDDEVKERRAELIGALQSRIMDKYNEGLMGRTLKILCEGFDRYSECYFGRSYADSPDIDGKVFFTGKKGIQPGEFVEVLITEELDGDLVGEAK